MFVPALLVALSYWLCWTLDGFLGWQTATRPIILGTITGLLCGDLVTGVVMGAALEAVYMGISGIGGVVAADYRSATAIAVGLTILSGITMEEGIALAAPIGAICMGLMNVTAGLGNLMEPVYIKCAKEGNTKKLDLAMALFALLGQHLIDTLVIFLSCYFGSGAIQTVFEKIPAWFLNGLGASGNMLVVVGLCLISQSIWSNSSVFFVLLGFVLSKYLGLPVLAITIIGVFLAYMIFSRNMAIAEGTRNVATATATEEDDFYG